MFRGCVQYYAFFMNSFLIAPARGEVVEERKE